MSASGRSTPVNNVPGTSSTNGSAVRVVLRIRPPAPPEASSNVPPRFQRNVLQALPGSTSTVSVDTVPSNASGTAAASPLAKNQGKQYFSYDRVFAPQDDQGTIFGVAEDLIGKFIEGYNVTCLAYGQTSSGKSYTMGTDHIDVETEGHERMGIIPRAVSEIFEKLDQRQREQPNAFSYQMKNSYIELYNEDLIDLMATDTNDRPQVSIREDKQGNIIWTGLKEAKVASAPEVMGNLELGSAVRQTSATDMNAQSSRSHAIFSLTLVQRKWAGSGPPPVQPPNTPGSRLSRIGLPRGASPGPGARPMSPVDRPYSRTGLRPPSSLGSPGRQSPGPNSSLDDSVDMMRNDSAGQWVTVTSKFHFVDLAGSERLKRTSAVGERVKEGISINSGLHALGNVISALGDPAKARSTTHIPYRDSKLTRLLQDSLGGNSWTLFVACVSPTEFNLSETINTLKYANRARNIKNQASVNEVEVGWDDLEHVQGLVVKLRGELNALKSGSGIHTIREEPPSPTKGATPASPAMLELQDRFADLSQKYAKLTAELAKNGGSASPANGRTPGSSLSPEDFAAAVEPVVEEYEKSLSALESQLSLTKAALSFAEEEMKTQETQHLDSKRQTDEEITELSDRVAKLVEREASTEAYIRDLEVKVKSSDEGDSAYQAVLTDLKKELARYKETEATTDAYIKELEARLASDDETIATLRKQIEKAERDLEKKDKLFHELESKLAELESGNRHRALLQEIHAKDERLEALGQQINAMTEESQTSDAERSQLAKHLQAEREQRDELRSQLADLETETPRPQTPNGDAAPRIENRLSMLQAHSSLQDRYDQTLAELESLNTKYKQSLQQIQQLNQQLDDNQLEEIDNSSGSPASSLNGGSKPPRSQRNSLLGDSDRTSLLLNSGQHSPNQSRRSMPIGVVSPTVRGSTFLAKAGVRHSSSQSHLRSASLSREPSLGSYLPTSPHASATPRSSSPNPSLSESLPEHQQRDRTYDSLLKEVAQLQGVLNSREAELAQLEATVREQSSRKGSLASSVAETQEAERATASVPLPEQEAEPTTASEASASQISPRSLELLSTLQTELGLDPADGSTDGLRVDDLMRSMAKKEAAHRDAVEDLNATLTALRKQHVDLEQLSKDQVANMSQEINSLHRQLVESHDSYQSSLQKVTELEAALSAQASSNVDSAEKEEAHNSLIESIKRDHAAQIASNDEDHAQTVSHLQEEHSTFLGQMIEERQALFVERAKEHDSELKAAQSEASATLDKLKQEHDETLRTAEDRIRNLEAERVALEASLKELAEQQADQDHKRDLFDSLHRQHEDALRRKDEEGVNLVERLKSQHRTALETQEQNLSTRAQHLQEEHEIALNNLIESQSQKMEEARQASEERATALMAKHQTEAEAHQAAKDAMAESHSAALQQLRADLEQAHQKHSAETDKLHQSSLEDSIAKARADALREAQEEGDAKLAELSQKMTEKESEAEARDREVADLKSSLRAEEERREAAERKHSEAQTSGEQTALDLAALKSAHEQATRTMEESRAAELERVRQEAEATRSTLQQERDQLGLEIDQLRKSATETNEKLESSLKQAEELRQAEPNANQEGELKDALAALSTLEQALVDSQEERDELLVQIDQLQKSADSTESTAEVEKVLTDTKSQLETAQKDLASANKDREELRSSQSKLAFLVKDLQAKAALSGKRSPDLTRTSSDASTDGGRISTQSISAKSPPTVPPPSMSLPPLPSGATGQSRSSNSPTPGNRSSNTPSSSRDSTSNTAGSRASTTSISTIDVNIDPRLQKKMEEQDANIVALNKQLAHCESDLRANIQLVSTLESALNESERNLRKSRMQLNEYAKERDQHAKTSDSLRQQLQSAFNDMERLRENLASAQKESDSRLAAERQQRDAARVQLEARMEEMRARKSKLNCF